jgi:hypothetical protein
MVGGTEMIETQQPEQRNEVAEIQKALISLNASIEADEIFTPTTAGIYGPKAGGGVDPCPSGSASTARVSGLMVCVPPHLSTGLDQCI